MKSLLLKPAKSLGILLVCLVMLNGSGAGVRSQIPEEKKEGHAEPYTDADAYQIYAALLRNEKRSLFVIDSQIHGWPDTKANDLGIKGDRKFMRAWAAAMEDYANQNRDDKIIVRHIPIDTTYELLYGPKILKPDTRNAGWEGFYERYPSAGGFYSFSAIGFNHRRTRAIVWMSYACGELCGTGTYHFFEKTSDTWREVSVTAEVMMIVS